MATAYDEHWARLLALLARQFRSLDLAEDALQDAFAAAAEHWPRTGMPVNPAAWLLTAARRRALDRLRRDATAQRHLPLLVTDELPIGPGEQVDVDALPDDRLRLVFVCCHPAISPDARAALTLRFVAGLSTPEIARLFLVSESTMAARIGRAKKKIAAAAIPFRIPEPAELPERLHVVLAVLYLLFTEGYAATAGPQLIRHELADEAIRLGRLLARLLPDEPDTWALLSLMLLHHARRHARVDAAGRVVPLAEQDRSRWNGAEIDEGFTLLARASEAGGRSRYLIQAEIAAEHAVARRATDTNWSRIAYRYRQLEEVTGSAVVRLNRAVAVAEAEGPSAALELLSGLDDALPRLHRVPATRAQLLARLGRWADARAAYDAALALVGTDAERAHLEAGRAAAVAELHRPG